MLKKTVAIMLCMIFCLCGALAEGTAVICYSRAGENYSVGTVEKGNTQIIAEMIAEKTGADLYMIDVAEAYPDNYEECTEIVQKEQSEGVERALKEDVDISAYDTVYIGYPIWWGKMATPMITFLKSHDWSGKAVIPFNTHEGSGQGSSLQTIETLCAGADIRAGIAIEGHVAQNDTEEAESLIDTWLAQ